MAKKKKKVLTRVEKIRRKDKRLFLVTIAVILIPIILMIAGIGVPGRAFIGP